jgi:glycosyltransferase involved in cell wall biosynthesis
MAAAVLQLLFFLIVYMRPVRRSKLAPAPEALTGQQPPVSVIVYARNESHNLEQHLPHLLGQEYPQYEIIVINDGSTEEGDELLTLLERQHPNLYHTFVPEESKYLSRRKLSLTLGIKAAKYDLLCFVQANCRPMSNQWLASMVRNYTDSTGIILGFCAYTTRKGFLHRIAAFDNLVNGTQYIASALAGKPFSGSGRNLSYRKAHFYDNKGFSHSLNLHAGDDDLFINRTATGANTRVEYSPDSITETAPFSSFGIWKDLKVARAATRRHYKGAQPGIYRLEAAGSILFIAAFAATLAVGIIGRNILLAASASAIYIILYTVKGIVWRRLAMLLRQRPIALSLPFIEAFRHMFDLYIIIYRLFRGKQDYTYTFGGKKADYR